jgi:hypothetical protein
MQEQTTATGGLAAASLRELSVDEVEMVSGGFGLPHISLPHINWGGIVHTVVRNVESHNWGQVASDAAEGASIGSAFGPWGAVIGGAAGGDFALFHQDFG